ncbi:MAG: DUF924 domain-containing protein [Rickettsiaceae bacterium]|nr:DUF924 domain-containing protein [Rickettsiaceae bacterium]
MTVSYNEIIKFWFNEVSPEKKWAKDVEFDALIAQRYGDIHNKAVNNELSFWRSSASGALAEIIILDQFSRNIYRDTPKAFEYDEMALRLAIEAINNKYDQDIDIEFVGFLYMPFMHSESANIHKEAIKLFSKKGLESFYEFELKHKEIIDRFGRYPHRNQILGRESTQEEILFLQQPGSSF